MTRAEIKNKYLKVFPNYSRLGKNLEDALKGFLEEQKIPFLDVNFRVKEFSSFYEKISRKKYNKPFEQAEDICALRIICYYVSDIKKIGEILEKEFKILESQDKGGLLKTKEFAYRSTHYIVKIDPSWIEAPNYRGLKDLKVEIQIRTILMHAWAEIEHKLNYKSDSQVPEPFLRKLYRLSAKFEEADEQFEDLKIGINKYQTDLTKNAVKQKGFDLEQEFNLNSLTAFVKYHFKGYSTNRDLSNTFDRLKKLEISFEELDKVISETKQHFKQIEKDLKDARYFPDSGFVASEFLTFTLDLKIERFYDEHKPDSPGWLQVLNNWKK